MNTVCVSLQPRLPVEMGATNTDIQVRWRRKGRQHDDYTDSTLLYPDAKVCAALYKGVSFYYQMRVWNWNHEQLDLWVCGS